jgi:hypothetical protein
LVIGAATVSEPFAGALPQQPMAVVVVTVSWMSLVMSAPPWLGPPVSKILESGFKASLHADSKSVKVEACRSNSWC